MDKARETDVSGGSGGFEGSERSEASDVTEESEVNTAPVNGVTRALEAASVSAAAQLTGSDTRLAAALRSSPYVTTILSADGLIEYQSPSSMELLGMEAAALLGVSFASLLRPADEAVWTDLLTGENGQDEPWVRVHWWLRSASGSYLPVDSRVSNMLDDPQVAGIVVHSRRDQMSSGSDYRYDPRWQAVAFLDPSTGLPNRGLYSDRLEQALARAERTEQPVSVILVDLEEESLSNDSAGDARADDLARAAGRRLTETIRSGETVARYSRGQLAVLTEPSATTHTERVASRLLEALTRPLPLGDSEVTVPVCIGLTTTSSAYESAGELLARAEIALNAAKAAGRPNYEIYHSDLVDETVPQLVYVPDQGVLDRNEMLLHYQPIFDLANGNIVGIEALLRWSHPDHGLLLPIQFLSEAEASGEIISIGSWVFPTVCEETVKIQSETGLTDLRVSVNVSMSELSDPDIVGHVTSALRESGLPPERLTLEVKESVLTDDDGPARHNLEAVRATGVRISIDDFGTHPTSLILLEGLPADEVKIDRTVAEAADHGDQAAAATLAGIVSLARSIGLRTTAEGIESDGELAQVRRAGCEFAQGYLLARPMEGARLRRMLGRRSSPFTNQVAVLTEILESVKVSSPAW